MMTNDELKQAIDRTRDYERNTAANDPTRALYQDHLKALLETQLNRAQSEPTTV